MQTQENARKTELIKALANDISVAKSDMDAAQRNFDMVYSSDEIDYYIYRLRAAQTRYDYLLKQLKEIC